MAEIKKLPQGSFAVKDGDGRIRTIEMSVLMLPSGAGPSDFISGPYQYRTAEGEEVDALGRGRYQIVKTGQILMVSSPIVPN